MSKRFYEAPLEGALRSAPAALRNREPIADVLKDWLPQTGLVVEIASGTGEHAVHFAGRFPGLEWQPSDVDEGALRSIRAWRNRSRLSNLLEPVEIDASRRPWPIERADSVVSINMVHISPWESALGLLDGAGRLLPDGGRLILYGPWLSDDVETAASNLEFDRNLKERNPLWGLRKVEDFEQAAQNRGFRLVGRRTMPANNLMLLFEKAKDGSRLKRSFTGFV